MRLIRNFNIVSLISAEGDFGIPLLSYAILADKIITDQ